MAVIWEWIDLVWCLAVPFFVPRRHWLSFILFILACVLMLRLQVDLMEDIGFAEGILHWIDFPLLQRGQILYGCLIAAFLALLHFSNEDNHYIFIAASVTVFFAGFTLSSLAMIL